LGKEKKGREKLSLIFSLPLVFKMQFVRIYG
jgi:hypothetical protein